MTDMIETQTAGSKPTIKRHRKMARDPEVARPALTEPRINKSDLVIRLLRRTGDATLDEMIAATDWLPHTTRAAPSPASRRMATGSQAKRRMACAATGSRAATPDGLAGK